MAIKTNETFIIRDALLYMPDGSTAEGDCLVEDGKIAELGSITGRASHDVDGSGLWLFPGAFDAHVHMREPGLTHKEDWDSGSRAAAAGGVTSAFDMPNTNPSTISPERLEEKYALIGQKARINYGLFFGANPENLQACLDARDAVCALKIFMASSTGDLLVDKEEELDRIFAAYEGRISVHAESEERLLARIAAYKGETDPAIHSVIRDPEAARLGVEMAARLANRYGRRLHILHMSTDAEVSALRAGRAEAAAKNTGARLTAEACPHHLFLNTTAYETWGNHVKMNPPLREEKDRAFMWEALRSGEVDMVATDHAPHSQDEKAKPFPHAPSGVPGIQTMLPLMLDAAHKGWCTPTQVVEWLCHAPSRIYEVEDRGRLEVGFAADLVLIDPTLERTITDQEQHSRCGWSPYTGRTTTGWPVRTFVNGVEVFRREGAGAGDILTDDATGQRISFAP